MENILSDILTVIGGASIIATVTPTDKDNFILKLLSAIIHAVAMNFGKAKNEEQY
jgi:pyruvate kinase